jgi:hypothetical protein
MKQHEPQIRSPQHPTKGPRASNCTFDGTSNNSKNNHYRVNIQPPKMAVISLDPAQSTPELKKAVAAVRIGSLIVKGFQLSQRPGRRLQIDIPSNIEMPGYVTAHVMNVLLKAWGGAHV